MASELYDVRLTARGERTPGWRELVALGLIYDDELIWELGLPGALCEGVDSWEGVFEALRAHAQAVGADALIDGLDPSVREELEDCAPLAEDARRLDDEALPHAHRGAALAAMLAALAPDRVSAFPVQVVDMEVVSVHPDAGFPWPQMPEDWYRKIWVLRLLHDAGAEGLAERLASQGGDIWGLTRFSEGADRVAGLIWGVRAIEIVDLIVDDPAFWEAHGDRWWRGHRGALTAPSGGEPYQAITFRLTLPVGIAIADRRPEG